MSVTHPEHAHASDSPVDATPTQRLLHPRSTPTLPTVPSPRPPRQPGARPDRPCPVPACNGQPLPGKRRFSSPLRNKISLRHATRGSPATAKPRTQCSSTGFGGSSRNRQNLSHPSTKCLRKSGSTRLTVAHLR
jgi:hypothetical protein